jgi:hypothetical protein
MVSSTSDAMVPSTTIAVVNLRIQVNFYQLGSETKTAVIFVE